MQTAEADADAQIQLIAIVAHELRYPLVPIRNAAALLQHEIVDATTIRHAAEIIERQVNGMNRLIGDLVDVSRMQRGKLEIRPARDSLSALLQCALESAQPFVNARGHTLSTSISREPVHLNMDLLRLSQALVNIIANATKYTDKRGEIRLSARREGLAAVIVVSDTGIGLAESELETIFGLFAKSAQGMRVEEGLGTGLYLARYFIEMHGGTVTATSRGIGKGSTFTVRLPCEPPAAPEFTGGGEVPRDGPIRA